ncbi:hypothetical protein DSCO28_61470 [Desulfosarcina ovata subsp. sediminis]|uniref:Uncharacterized protein n=1 Tax=Desulfosarcina ovata subsp. sediminis TaxID=885957 RepID=A0A5K7ZZL2_9BACT|nr:hypothetical protein [Desulfosarcina ovata]BBO85581.1 hypothetical protein DSCO28_61470 [Desulfosarcina ovata subsp. sediminis]
MKTAILLGIGCLWMAIPTALHALTAQEILLLKQNGVSEKTIQMMLESEIEATRSVQAKNRAMGIQTITRPNGQPAIVYSTGNGEDEARKAHEHQKEQQAWEMLRHLIVDTRRDSVESSTE